MNIVPFNIYKSQDEKWHLAFKEINKPNQNKYWWQQTSCTEYNLSDSIDSQTIPETIGQQIPRIEELCRPCFAGQSERATIKMLRQRPIRIKTFKNCNVYQLYDNRWHLMNDLLSRNVVICNKTLIGPTPGKKDKVITMKDLCPVCFTGRFQELIAILAVSAKT
jgi:hypothetical protein